MALTNTVVNLLKTFGSDGYIIRETQDTGSVPGSPSFVVTQEAVKYLPDERRRYLDPNTEERPVDLVVWIRGITLFTITTDETFQSSDGKKWEIVEVGPVEYKGDVIIQSLRLMGSQ